MAVRLNSLQCVWVFLRNGFYNMRNGFSCNVLLICVMGFIYFSRFVKSMYRFSRNCLIC